MQRLLARRVKRQTQGQSRGADGLRIRLTSTEMEATSCPIGDSFTISHGVSKIAFR